MKKIIFLLILLPALFSCKNGVSSAPRVAPTSPENPTPTLGCDSSADCTEPGKGICSYDHECIECQSDDDCASRGSGWECSANHTCVQRFQGCASNSDCVGRGGGWVCSSDNQCVCGAGYILDPNGSGNCVNEH